MYTTVQARTSRLMRILYTRLSSRRCRAMARRWLVVVATLFTASCITSGLQAQACPCPVSLYGFHPSSGRHDTPVFEQPLLGGKRDGRLSSYHRYVCVCSRSDAFMIQNADVGYHHLGGILPPVVHDARMVDLSQSAQTGAMWSQNCCIR